MEKIYVGITRNVYVSVKNKCEKVIFGILHKLVKTENI